ncbi:MAG: redoxin domain-containing protein [Candidatus Sumerlaeia bacterium]|nr:redoxin domain-containing protein [Candidatus Sumerlaeia bacterium]
MPRKPEETHSTLIGKSAPAFTLPDQEGKSHKLSDFKGKYVVLFFYQKESTPEFPFTYESEDPCPTPS